MADYTFDIYPAGSALSGGTIGNPVTITVSDEDDIGIGDLNGGAGDQPETGAWPVITAVSDPAFNWMLGQEVSFEEQGELNGVTPSGFDYFLLGMDRPSGDIYGDDGNFWIAHHPDNPDAFSTGDTWDRINGDATSESVSEEEGQPVSAVDHTVNVIHLDGLLTNGLLPTNGETFTVSTIEVETISIHDSGSEITTLDDSVASPESPTDPDGRDTQIVTGSIGGTDFTGDAIYATGRYNVSGSDGSSFQVSVLQVNRFGTGPEITTEDGYFVTTGYFVPGVEYTFTYDTVAWSGNIDYADLVSDHTNFVVDGTSGDDVIDAAYTGDPEGDMVDNLDHADGSNRDIIEGGAGNDVIDGGEAADTIDGGDDADTIIVREDEFGGDQVTGGEGGVDNDTLDASTMTNDVAVIFDDDEIGLLYDSADLMDFAEIETVITGSGDDDVDASASGVSQTIVTNDGIDVVIGGAGDDVIDTGAEDDTAYGGSGNDSIDGGLGDDLIFGGSEADSISGGTGNDVIHGDDIPAPNLVGNGSFEDGPEATNANQISAATGWFSWNDASPDVQDDQGFEESWSAHFDATDGDRYASLVNTANNGFAEGIGKELDQDLVSGEEYTLSVDAAAGHWDGTDYDTPGSWTLRVWGHTSDGVTASGVGGTPPGAVLLGTINVDSTDGSFPDLQSYPLTFTAPSDISTIYLSTAPTTGLRTELAIDNVVLTAGDEVAANPGDDSIDGGLGDDVIFGDDGDDTLSGGLGADTLTGGDGNDVFIYTAGDGVDRVIDFGTGESGSINDGDQTNNDLVDLSGFYNPTTLAAVNGAGGSFSSPLDLLRADAADGVLDGVIGGTDYSALIGNINLTLQNGGTAVTGTGLTFDNTNVVCFAQGTRIATARGEVPVETLRSGDLLHTADGGLQPVRWIGSWSAQAEDLRQGQHLRPIRIEAGALGEGLPLRRLLVSPQHRVLVRSVIVERMFGIAEVLVAAKHLTGLPGIARDDSCSPITYWHFLLDAHHVVWAEGAESESLFTGAETLKALGPVAWDEIRHLCDITGAHGATARHSPSGKLARKLAMRHAANDKPLVAPPASITGAQAASC